MPLFPSGEKTLLCFQESESILSAVFRSQLHRRLCQDFRAIRQHHEHLPSKPESSVFSRKSRGVKSLVTCSPIKNMVRHIISAALLPMSLQIVFKTQACSRALGFIGDGNPKVFQCFRRAYPARENHCCRRYYRNQVFSKEFLSFLTRSGYRRIAISKRHGCFCSTL